jgi:hypothetical protein
MTPKQLAKESEHLYSAMAWQWDEFCSQNKPEENDILAEAQAGGALARVRFVTYCRARAKGQDHRAAVEASWVLCQQVAGPLGCEDLLARLQEGEKVYGERMERVHKKYSK